MISTLENLLHSPGRMKKAFFYWTVRDLAAFRLFRGIMEELYEDGTDLEIRHFWTSAAAAEDSPRSRVLQLAANKVHAQTQVDIRLGHRTKEMLDIGRPDWNVELNRVVRAARLLGLTKAGIFFCGPQTMASDVRATAIHMSNDVDLHFYKETF